MECIQNEQSLKHSRKQTEFEVLSNIFSYDQPGLSPYDIGTSTYKYILTSTY